jgi:hypothetical protein
VHQVAGSAPVDCRHDVVPQRRTKIAQRVDDKQHDRPVDAGLGLVGGG